MNTHENNNTLFSNPDHEKFYGIFTDKIRHQLKVKRLQLGLSYSTLGEFFGINWSTIRKWEIGPTKACSAFYIKKITRFISGDFDATFEGNRGHSSHKYLDHVPEIVSQCSERVSNTYWLCRHSPELRKQLMNDVVDVTNDIINTLTDYDKEKLTNDDDPELF